MQNLKTNCIVVYMQLSYVVVSGSEITPYNKICKPLVVYRFTRNVITSITTLRMLMMTKSYRFYARNEFQSI